MKLTESNLRNIIRQVILEEYNNSDELNEGWKETLAGLGLVASTAVGGFNAEAKPLKHYDISAITDQVIEDNLGDTVDMRIEGMIEEVLSLVDESQVDDVMEGVINPWMSAVKMSYTNAKYKDPITGRPYNYIYDNLRNLLNKKVKQYTESASKSDKKRRPGRAETRLSKTTLSVLSAKDLKRYKKAVEAGDQETIAGIINKYRNQHVR